MSSGATATDEIVTDEIPHNLASLVKILQSFKRKKTEIRLPKSSNCFDFWQQLARDMYNNRTLETMPDEGTAYNFDYTVKRAMLDFQQNDSLDVLTKKGRILKRLANHYRSMWGHKLPDSVSGIIGDRLQYYLSSSEEKVYILDFTDTFDWPDGYFGKSGSCWWGGYCDSLPTFQNGGGWAVRFYSGMGDKRGIGRTWIRPQDGVLVCFNSYGVDRPITSKVIKQLFYSQGITLHYKAVEVENSQDNCIPYINGDSGFVLYPDWLQESDVESEYDLDLEVYHDERPECHECDARFDDNQLTQVGNYAYCQSCLDLYFSYCEHCEEYRRDRDVYPDSDGYSICRDCAGNKGLELCVSCNTYHDASNMIFTADSGDYFCDSGDYFCKSCAARLHHCESCDSYFHSRSRYDRHVARHEEENTEYDFISGQMETVKPYSGDNFTTLVYRHENVPGLFIYKQSDDCYKILHEQSGLTLRSDITFLWQAVEIVTRLASVDDWTQDKDTIVENEHTMSVLWDVLRDVLPN